jgi:hypothetical protein
MSHTNLASPTTNIEVDRARLRNVFNVLAKPQHTFREKALELRLEISSKWGNCADQNQWFPWPTTIASPGVRKLKGVEWREHGMLSFLGYHVGQTEPTPLNVRRSILEYAFECHLPPLDGLVYYLEWGMPKTAQRLRKTANTLAALTRNAKRRDVVSYAKAIDDWESDLDFMREKYYLGVFHFGWPDTVFMH